MKILSLFFLCTAFLSDAYTAEIPSDLPQGKMALIQSVINAPSSAENRIPADFKARFKRDSVKVKNAITIFFNNSNELQCRLNDFDHAYNYGVALFKERNDGTAHSRNLALVYLSYAALMSKDTGENKYGFSPIRKFRMEYKNPQTILDQIPDSHLREEDCLLKSESLFLPLLSKTGHLTLEMINECYSRSIAVIGIPYGSHDQNNFDTSKEQSPLEFVIHDLQHAGDYLFPAKTSLSRQNLDTIRNFSRTIYDHMRKEGLTHAFAIAYFMTFHEDGMSLPLSGEYDCIHKNPIQNQIIFLNDLYTTAYDQRDHIIKSILKRKRGFKAIESARLDKSNKPFRTFSDCITAQGVDDIILNEKDLIEKRYGYSYNIFFQLKSHPNSTFLLNSITYNKMLENAVDHANLLNAYGAQLEIPEDITQFNVNALLEKMLRELNAFNAAYGNLFDET